MKKLIILIVVLTTCTAIFSQAPQVDWVHNYGGSVEAIHVDDNGYIFTLGAFNQATFGTFYLDSQNGGSTFLYKSDAAGNVLWAKQYGNANGIGSPSPLNVKTDAAGNIYIYGYFSNTATFGSTTLTSSGATDLFICKLDAAGNVLWAKKFGNTGYELGYHGNMAVDESGNVYIGARFQVSITIGSTTYTSAGAEDLIMIKMDPNGNVLWSNKFGGNGRDQNRGVTVDATGNSYYTGEFVNTITFGSTTLTSSAIGESAMYILKLNPSGSVVWAKKITGRSYGATIDVTDDGDLYIAGTFGGTVSLGSFSVTSVTPSNADVVFSKLDTDGNVTWVKNVGSTVDVYVNAMHVKSNGNLLLSGYFSGTSVAGASTGSFDIYVAEYTSLNTFVWGKKFGSTQTDFNYCLATGPNNAVYIGGRLSNNSSIQFDSHTVTATNYMTAYMVSLSDCNPTTHTITETACGGFELNNETYTTSGTYTQVLENAAGCDSTITLNLTINQPTNSSAAITECGSYTWPINNQTYTTSGAYTHVIPNANNCDSTITLNLTINQPTSSSVTVAECESYTWSLNSQTYTSSGTYTHVIPNTNNCDSTITLNLTINQPSTATLTQTACGSYTLNGQTYPSSGTYTQVVSNAASCDSTITLNLTINDVNTTVTASGIVLTATQSGATYQWIDCDNNDAPIAGATAQSFTPTQNGNYAVTITANGCTETSDCMPVNSVGIEAVAQNGWSVYPNPGNGVFMVQGESLSTATIKVMNCLGQELIPATTFSNDILTIDLGQDASGVYLLEIYDGKSSITIRLLKQQ